MPNMSSRFCDDPGINRPRNVPPRQRMGGVPTWQLILVPGNVPCLPPWTSDKETIQPPGDLCRQRPQAPSISALTQRLMCLLAAVTAAVKVAYAGTSSERL